MAPDMQTDTIYARGFLRREVRASLLAQELENVYLP